MVYSVQGSFVQRMMDGIELSETARTDAQRRGAEVRDQTRTSLMRRAGRRGPYQRDPLTESIAEQHVADDYAVRLAIGNEQWGQRLTTMYGVAQLVTDSQKMHAQLDEITELLRTTNRILSRLVPQDTRS